MAYDIARKGSQGNRSLLSKYGGSPGSGPGARNKYASGGAVKAYAFGGKADDDDEDNPAIEADGEASAKRLDRPGRKMKGKDKGKDGKGKTDINIVIMAGKDGPPGPIPPMPMAGPPPPPAGPMPPPGPVPMQAGGGRVNRASGGVVKAAGQDTASEKESQSAAMRRASGGGVKDYMDKRAAKHRFGAGTAALEAAGMGTIAAVDPEPVTKTIAGGLAGLAGVNAYNEAQKAKQFSKGSNMWGKTGLPDRPERKAGGRAK